MTNHPSLSPVLVFEDTRAAMDFYERAFGARRVPPMLTMPDGSVAHAEMALGDGVLMLSDAKNSPTDGAWESRTNLMVADADAVWAAARTAGAEVLLPLGDQFYGHRSGRLRDPFGHQWIISQVLEEMSEAEMQARLDRFDGSA